MKRELGIAIGTLLLGLLLGYFFFSGGKEEKQAEAGTEKAEKAQTYTCSMHPQVRKDEPGKCPICGMDLIPVKNMANTSETVLEMSETAVELGNIQTSPVRRIAPEKTLRMQGEVQVDERRLSLITARFPGRIEKLYVDFTGQKVHKGQKLAAIYSPKLIQAQRELFEALKEKDENPALYKAARSKLRLWDLSKEQIEAIEDSGKPQKLVNIRAPHSGIVTKRKVTLGEYLKEGTPLFKLADLSKVWVMFHAYEQDLPWLDEGDKVRFTVAGLPDQEFESTIRFIHPTMKKGTRTVSVRAETRNPNGELRPGMFATGRIKAELDLEGPRIVLPESAVLWTGTRSVVWVEVPNTEKPTYEFREVELGADLGPAHIVQEGVDTSERVVTHGAFRVDAAAQLAGKKSMMQQMGGGAQKKHGSKKSSGTSSEAKALKDSKPPESWNNLIDAYLELKNALVASDPEKAHRGASKGLERLDAMKGKLSEDQKGAWEAFDEKLRNSLTGIQQAEKELKEQRKHFGSLSSTMVQLVRAWNTGGQEVLYRTHCPMAMNGKGADWLSAFEKVKNPYYGEKMMNCGSVKESFKN